MAEYSSSSSSSSSSSPSPAAAHEVAANSDLLIEILIRLPIRSLMRFKSVSKSWLSLITSDFFALHRNPDSTAVSGLYLHPLTINIIPEIDFIPLIETTKTQTEDPHPQFIDLAFFPGFSGNIRIIGSCHGLLLCCFGLTENNSPKPDYVILNPTTKQFKILPKCHLSDLRGLTLAFDPSKSPHYKVVCLHYIGSVSMSYGAGPNYQIMMYSSETGSWEASGVPFAAKWREQYNAGVYWNGAINWFSNWGSGDSVYYNVDEERLGIIPLLPIPEGSYWSTPEFRSYGESRGHLHLVQTHYRTKWVDVYEMESDYSGWFLKHSVDPYAVGIPRAPWFGIFNVLCVVQMERDEESYLVLNIPGKILRYNFGDRTLKKIFDVEVGTLHEAPLIYSWCGSYQYIESLARV